MNYSCQGEATVDESPMKQQFGPRRFCAAFSSPSPLPHGNVEGLQQRRSLSCESNRRAAGTRTRQLSPTLIFREDSEGLKVQRSASQYRSLAHPDRIDSQQFKEEGRHFCGDDKLGIPSCTSRIAPSSAFVQALSHKSIIPRPRESSNLKEFWSNSRRTREKLFDSRHTEARGGVRNPSLVRMRREDQDSPHSKCNSTVVSVEHAHLMSTTTRASEGSFTRVRAMLPSLDRPIQLPSRDCSIEAEQLLQSGGPIYNIGFQMSKSEEPLHTPLSNDLSSDTLWTSTSMASKQLLDEAGEGTPTTTSGTKSLDVDENSSLFSSKALESKHEGNPSSARDSDSTLAQQSRDMAKQSDDNPKCDSDEPSRTEVLVETDNSDEMHNALMGDDLTPKKTKQKRNAIDAPAKLHQKTKALSRGPQIGFVEEQEDSLSKLSTPFSDASFRSSSMVEDITDFGRNEEAVASIKETLHLDDQFYVTNVQSALRHGSICPSPTSTALLSPNSSVSTLPTTRCLTAAISDFQSALKRKDIQPPVNEDASLHPLRSPSTVGAPPLGVMDPETLHPIRQHLNKLPSTPISDWWTRDRISNLIPAANVLNSGNFPWNERWTGLLEHLFDNEYSSPAETCFDFSNLVFSEAGNSTEQSVDEPLIAELRSIHPTAACKGKNITRHQPNGFPREFIPVPFSTGIQSLDMFGNRHSRHPPQSRPSTTPPGTKSPTQADPPFLTNNSQTDAPHHPSASPTNEPHDKETTGISLSKVQRRFSNSSGGSARRSRRALTKSRALSRAFSPRDAFAGRRCPYPVLLKRRLLAKAASQQEPCDNATSNADIRILASTEEGKLSGVPDSDALTKSTSSAKTEKRLGHSNHTTAQHHDQRGSSTDAQRERGWSVLTESSVAHIDEKVRDQAPNGRDVKKVRARKTKGENSEQGGRKKKTSAGDKDRSSPMNGTTTEGPDAGLSTLKFSAVGKAPIEPTDANQDQMGSAQCEESGCKIDVTSKPAESDTKDGVPFELCEVVIQRPQQAPLDPKEPSASLPDSNSLDAVPTGPGLSVLKTAEAPASAHPGPGKSSSRLPATYREPESVNAAWLRSTLDPPGHSKRAYSTTPQRFRPSKKALMAHSIQDPEVDITVSHLAQDQSLSSPMAPFNGEHLLRDPLQRLQRLQSCQLQEIAKSPDPGCPSVHPLAFSSYINHEWSHNEEKPTSSEEVWNITKPNVSRVHRRVTQPARNVETSRRSSFRQQRMPQLPTNDTSSCLLTATSSYKNEKVVELQATNNSSSATSIPRLQQSPLNSSFQNRPSIPSDHPSASTLSPPSPFNSNHHLRHPKPHQPFLSPFDPSFDHISRNTNPPFQSPSSSLNSPSPSSIPSPFTSSSSSLISSSSIPQSLFRSPVSPVASMTLFTPRHINPIAPRTSPSSRSPSPQDSCDLHRQHTSTMISGRGRLYSGASIIEVNSNLAIRFDLPPSEIIPQTELVLEAAVSKGTFGTVFRGTWKGCVVAIKWSHTEADCRMSDEQLRNLQREVNTYRMLSHPHVVRYFGVCIDPTFLAIVTEYLPGGNVFDLLFENRLSVSAETRYRMAIQLVTAVKFMHEQSPSIIHRDLKTANLVLDAAMNLKLCDFGKTRTMPGPFLILDDNGGSPRYMSPEGFRPGGQINQKSDIWSLACCLIEIFGGPIPYEDLLDNSSVISRILGDCVTPEVPYWFHPRIQRCLRQCLSWNPQSRPEASTILHEISSVSPHTLRSFGMDCRLGIQSSSPQVKAQRFPCQ